MKLGLQLLESLSKTGDMTGYIRDIVLRLRKVIDNSGLGFGDGNDPDNIHGMWVNYTTNAVANTEDTINHDMGEVPIGYLVFSQDKAATLYKGGTAWTSTQIFLKCNTASVAVRIFILPPSVQTV